MRGGYRSRGWYRNRKSAQMNEKIERAAGVAVAHSGESSSANANRNDNPRLRKSQAFTKRLTAWATKREKPEQAHFRKLVEELSDAIKALDSDLQRTRQEMALAKVRGAHLVKADGLESPGTKFCEAHQGWAPESLIIGLPYDIKGTDGEEVVSFGDPVFVGWRCWHVLEEAGLVIGRGDFYAAGMRDVILPIVGTRRYWEIYESRYLRKEEKDGRA